MRPGGQQGRPARAPGTQPTPVGGEAGPEQGPASVGLVVVEGFSSVGRWSGRSGSPGVRLRPGPSHCQGSWDRREACATQVFRAHLWSNMIWGFGRHRFLGRIGEPNIHSFTLFFLSFLPGSRYS